MKRKVNYKSNLSYYEIAEFIRKYITSETVIVCIGTDKCIGDCLGPLVGTFLEESSFPVPVYGTLQSPIHALNIDKKIDEIKKTHPQATIIGIDACLGDTNSIGEIHVRDYPIHPGKGVGKSLPEVGVASIIGIVDSSDNAEFFTSRGIRLSLVFEMARVICHGLNHAYYLNSSYNK
ncbi:spore protease YyaC [Clostridium sp. NSJ-49]|uniref:Putative sporulation protein YyaC n=1 Tax=Clostridium disporicum TaxID=84024 RepID=A0A174FNT2_9CLOT|nr:MULTISPECIES: spore protease YyaC [Clostridium]MBC5626731.1 spore protease YyaC [Clostridium sp. NSJ-49]MCD2501508.1 spore protease YyaC [Clostridium sp. NSJ-145]CUO51381.1 putative sporulation protein YyaC [Clostridium disporicum]